MNLTREFHEAIDRIIKHGNFQGTTMSDQLFLDYAYTYTEIQREFVGRKDTLKKGCGGCIGTAKRIVWNYIDKYHSIRLAENSTKKANVVMVSVNNDLNYKQLLALAKEKGFVGRNPKKAELIEYLK